MLDVIIPYDGDARGPSPGARYVSQHRRQADWHERVLLWKLRDSEEAQAKDGGACCTCRRKFPSGDLMRCDACSHHACDDCMAWRIINDYEYWFCPCCLDRMVPVPPPPLPPGPPPTQAMPIGSSRPREANAVETDTSRSSLDAPPGFVWAIADVGGSGIYTVGWQVTLPSGTVVVGRHAAATVGLDLSSFASLRQSTNLEASSKIIGMFSTR